jgi:hypothetical protein
MSTNNQVKKICCSAFPFAFLRKSNEGRASLTGRERGAAQEVGWMLTVLLALIGVCVRLLM